MSQDCLPSRASQRVGASRVSLSAQLLAIYVPLIRNAIVFVAAKEKEKKGFDFEHRPVQQGIIEVARINASGCSR